MLDFRLLVLSLLFSCPLGASAVNKEQCWPYRFINPFEGSPVVTDKSGDTVTVQWNGIVTVPYCIDNFFVRYWEKGKYYKENRRSKLVTKNTFSVDVEVEAGKPFRFQVVATQDGVEKFKTEPPVEHVASEAPRAAAALPIATLVALMWILVINTI